MRRLDQHQERILTVAATPTETPQATRTPKLILTAIRNENLEVYLTTLTLTLIRNENLEVYLTT